MQKTEPVTSSECGWEEAWSERVKWLAESCEAPFIAFVVLGARNEIIASESEDGMACSLYRWKK